MKPIEYEAVSADGIEVPDTKKKKRILKEESQDADTDGNKNANTSGGKSGILTVLCLFVFALVCLGAILGVMYIVSQHRKETAVSNNNQQSLEHKKQKTRPKNNSGQNASDWMQDELQHSSIDETSVSLCDEGIGQDKCMNEANHRQCKALEQEECLDIRHYGCPYTFECQDGNLEDRQDQDGLRNRDYTICKSPQDDCMNPHNHGHCIALRDSGCHFILPSKTCPIQFSCQDAQVKQPSNTKGVRGGN